MKTKIKVKPLSVNNCWQGRRYKTELYKAYEKECFAILPSLDIKNPRELYLFFGVSNVSFDFDNGIKPFVDILQKKYNFNDRTIMYATIQKLKVPKGEEYIKFELK